MFAKKQDSAIVLIGCIEDHQFQPQNYWFVRRMTEINPICWTEPDIMRMIVGSLHVGTVDGDLSGLLRYQEIRSM